MKVLTRDGLHSEFAVALEVDDEQLETIRRNPTYYYYETFAREVCAAKGENLFFHTIFCGKTFTTVRNMIPLLLESYKSVSWLDKRGKFTIRRR